MTEMRNYVTIGAKDGKAVGAANAESLDEARSTGECWIRNDVADAYVIWCDGKRVA